MSNDVAKVAAHADDAAKAAGKVDNLTDLAKAAPSNPCSFDAGTPVLTPSGLVAIERLKPGDAVLAYDEASDVSGVYTVTARMAHLDPAVVILTLAGETIDTTPEHPFYTLGGAWKPAGALVRGDLVRRADGTFGAVETVRLVVRPALMYNLTVAQAHTFFVGEEGWLVHNACPIFGNAQVTSDPNHALNSQALATYYSNQPGVKEVHLNRTLNSVTSGKVKSLKRPDVTVVYNDNSYRLGEVTSRSQSKLSQVRKVNAMNQQLRKAGIKTKKGIVK